MASSRHDRLQQRLRGAQRHQVADTSFGLILPQELEENILGAPPSVPVPVPVPVPLAPAPALASESSSLPQISPRPATSPKNSVKRRKLNGDGTQNSTPRVRNGTVPSTPIAGVRTPQAHAGPASALFVHADHGGLRNARESQNPPVSWSKSSVEIPASQSGRIESTVTEIEESPTNAPGSGRRRIILTDSAAHSSHPKNASNHPSDDEDPLTSSPSIHKSLGSKPVVHQIKRALVQMTYDALGDDEIDELSPTEVRKPQHALSSSPTARVQRLRARRLGAANSQRESAGSQLPKRSIAKSSTPVQSLAIDRDSERAEAISDHEAARLLGRQKPMSVARGTSPELGVDSQSTEVSPHRPPTKAVSQTVLPAIPNRGQKRKLPSRNPGRAKIERSRPQTDVEDTRIPITIQRFSKLPPPDKDDPDADVLNMNIPCVSRGGVNTVDVLSQVCEEVIDTSITAIRQALHQQASARSKKAYRIKIKAIQAFREELQTRFLQHTILLDTMYSLRKRVKKVQKDQSTLRLQVADLLEEREQVALAIDAIRTTYEVESEESQRRLNLSKSMHDLDLAVHQGMEAGDVPREHRKTAELGNLELRLMTLSDQVCQGGLLESFVEFNAFLERTALVLESR